MTERPEDAMSEDWSDLTAAWTAPTEAPVVPVAEIARRVRRRAAWARINFYTEAAGCFLAAGVGVWVSLKQGSWGIALAALAFCAVALALTLWARGGGDPDPADTPEQALQASLSQARSGLRWARAGQLLGPVALAFVAYIIWDKGPETVAGALAAVSAFMLAFGLFYERHARRAKARIAQAREALRELASA